MRWWRVLQPMTVALRRDCFLRRDPGRNWNPGGGQNHDIRGRNRARVRGRARASIGLCPSRPEPRQSSGPQPLPERAPGLEGEPAFLIPDLDSQAPSPQSGKAAILGRNVDIKEQSSRSKITSRGPVYTIGIQKAAGIPI